MRENFDVALHFTLGAEGVFSDDPEDSGNWTGGKKGVGTLKGTKYGISARAYPDLDIKDLAPEQAAAIYRRDYWDKCGCDSLAYPLDVAVFDTSVNCGVGGAGKILARSSGFIDFLFKRIAYYISLKGDAPDGWFQRCVDLYERFVNPRGTHDF